MKLVYCYLDDVRVEGYEFDQENNRLKVKLRLDFECEDYREIRIYKEVIIPIPSMEVYKEVEENEEE